MRCNIIKINQGIPDLLKEGNKILEFTSRVEAEEYITRNNILLAVPTDVSGIKLGTIAGTLLTSFINNFGSKK